MKTTIKTTIIAALMAIAAQVAYPEYNNAYDDIGAKLIHKVTYVEQFILDGLEIDHSREVDKNQDLIFDNLYPCLEQLAYTNKVNLTDCQASIILDIVIRSTGYKPMSYFLVDTDPIKTAENSRKLKFFDDVSSRGRFRRIALNIDDEYFVVLHDVYFKHYATWYYGNEYKNKNNTRKKSSK